jgi:acetyl-CoA C-acetyltransferase
MKFSNVAFPVKYIWSSPFARWQGTISEISSLDTGVAVTARALGERGIDTADLKGLVHGWTNPMVEIFYGAPTIAARIGAPHISGPMVVQACATSVASIQTAAAQVQSDDDLQLVVCADRMSNGAVVIYPQPSAPCGAPKLTNWTLDGFAKDPVGGTSMLVTADNVARMGGITREQCDDLKAQRYEQYESALANDREFQKRYMVPVEVQVGRKTVTLEADEGIRAVDRETIRGMKTVMPDGFHTGATQTHPADGVAGVVLTSSAQAHERSGGEGVVEVLSTGIARVQKAHMPAAPVPAAQSALQQAGLSIEQVDLVTTHNPFAVNDVYFSQQTGFPLDKMNLRGCSLIFGHPQSPTGMRSIAELVHELKSRGGGVGLFTGCAAGDSGMALVLRVTD